MDASTSNYLVGNRLISCCVLISVNKYQFFTTLSCSAGFFHLKQWSYTGTMKWCRVFPSYKTSTHYKQFLNQIFKNKACTIFWKKQKERYDPKIETVKYLELICQNKIRVILNTTSKVWKFPGHASSHSTFKSLFYVIPTQIWKNLRDIKMIYLLQ